MTMRKLDLLYTAYLKAKGIISNNNNPSNTPDKASYVDNKGCTHIHNTIEACCF